jgi:L-amino acid N-acyltransferase YncA
MNDNITLRTMVKADLNALELIENESFFDEDPDFEIMTVSNQAWTKREIRRCAFKEEKTLGWVVEEGQGNIVGYYIYEEVSDGILIRRLIIHPQYRNSGFGRTVITKLYEKVAESKTKKTLSAIINERDILTCKWMAHMGFKSKLIRQGWDDDTDAVKFTFTATRCLTRGSRRLRK